MKTYSIPINWSSYSRIEVEAENLKDAVKKAFDKFYATPDENYLEDSALIDDIIHEEYPDEVHLLKKKLYFLELM